MNSCASIIIPALDPTARLADCLLALLTSKPLPDDWQVEVIILVPAANTHPALLPRKITQLARSLGWTLRLVEMSEGSKLDALNHGESISSGDVFIYLNPQIRVSSALISQLALALDTCGPRYACGRLRMTAGDSRIAMAFGRILSDLPLFQQDAGFGVFAVNRAGRTRWDAFPDVILDDTFVQLHFAAQERICVPGIYTWPVADGFSNLVRFCRRRAVGRQEIAKRFPGLMKSVGDADIPGHILMSHFMRDPVAVGTYATVALAAKTPLFRTRARWAD